MRKINYLAVLVITAAILFCSGLGMMDLSDPDESFYAETAREMYEDGEWLTPHIFDEPQFEKPPLYYWLIILSYRAFGVNEFAARFPSALFGIIGVAAVFYLAALFYGRKAGFFAGLALMTSALYMALAVSCVTDMVLTVFILLCLTFFAYAWQKGDKRLFYASALSAALAVLTKGPIGLFLPGMVILLYLTFTRQWNKLWGYPVLSSLVLFLAVSLPWYLAVTAAHGDAFIGEFFGSHNVTRFLEPEHRIGSSPFFYIPVLLGGIIPWTVFMPQAVIAMFRGRLTGRPGFKGKGLFLLFWFLTVFIFFSISRTKLVTYIFPLWPVPAIAAGAFLAALTDPAVYERWRRSVNISYIVLILAGIGGAVAGPLVFRHEFPGVNILPQMIAGEVFLLICFAVSFALFARKKVTGAIISLAGGVAVAGLVAIFMLPALNEHVSSRYLSERYLELASPEEPLAGECDHRRGIAFYAGKRNINDIHPYHQLKLFMRRPERVWAMLQDKHYDQLTRDEGAEVEVFLVDKAGEYRLITNRPLEDGENGE
jgi:4-amino-4-deoxy-L-arabinose transferase-like glycosyltransferase